MRLSLASFLLLSACAAPPGAAGSEVAPDPPAARVDAGGELRERLEASLPGEELASLAALAGEWEVEVSLLEGESERSLGAGEATVTPVLSGRFLEWRVTTRVAGVEVRSRGLLGHDRERGVFELSWATESSSAQRLARGRGDARRGGILLELAELDAGDGGVRRSRTRLRLESDDAFSLLQETWDPEQGDWRGLTRTRYQRRGADG